MREGLSRSRRAPPEGASERRRRLDAADQQFELGDLVIECGLAGLGEGDPGAGALSGVALLNPVEPVWSHLKRSLANLTKHNISQLTALVKTRLKRMQYRPS